MSESKAESAPAGAPLRCGIVAVVGRANVGKSTLINRIHDEKVSIVSPVAQTTRNLIRSVYTDPRGQIVVLDTPGVHKAESDLGQIMNRIARHSNVDADLTLLVLDASSAPRQEDEGWMKRLTHQEFPCLFLFNKTDLVPLHEEEYRQMLARVAPDKAAGIRWLRVAAETGAGVPELITALLEMLPAGEMLFDSEMLSDYPRLLAIADLIREKLFGRLFEELPHAVAVRVDHLIEDGPLWTIDASILCNRSSQKGIIIGEKGRLLRAVRRSSEKEIAAIYECEPTLHLRVKVEEHWARKHYILKQLGYLPAKGS